MASGQRHSRAGPSPASEYLGRLDSVHGWLRPECALLVCRLGQRQSVSGNVGEIGVHHGKFFILLSLLRRAEESAVAVDLFEDQASNVDHSGAGDRQAFEANLRRFGAADRVTVTSADSTTISAAQLRDSVGGGAFRLFSVDGGHTPEITASDMALVTAVLAEGGLLILDDYFNEAWPGVSEGANRFLSSQTELVGIGSAHGKSFFTRGEDHAEEYRAQMRRIGEEEGWQASEQPFFGHPHVALVVKAPPTLRARVEQLAGDAKRRVLGDRT